MDLAAAGAKTKKWAIRGAIGLVALLVVGSTVYTLFTLYFTYSRGERVGYVQKLSKRGWLCKTDEGELAMVNQPGQSAQMFDFTVRNDAIVKQIEELSGHRVVLVYEEHAGVPSSCFGDTTYFVTGVRKAE